MSALAIKKREYVKFGSLKKKSPSKFRKQWQARYFVLYKDGYIYYFKNKPNLELPDSSEPSGTIPLTFVSECKLCGEDKKPVGHRFQIIMKDNKRVFDLQADTPQVCNDWVDAINKTMQECRDQQVAEASLINSSGKYWKDTAGIQRARAESNQFGSYSLRRDDFNSDSDFRRTSTYKLGSPRQSVAAHAADTNEPQFVIETKIDDIPIGKNYIVKETRNDARYLMHVVLKTDKHFKAMQKLFVDMQQLKHQYVFQQVHQGECEDAVFAMYTCAPFDSLFVHMQSFQNIPEHVTRIFGAQIVSALKALHSRGHCFRNMRAENIFVDESGSAVISDFLLLLPPDLVPEQMTLYEYHTPERISGLEEDPARGDWWRFGVLLYELLVGIPPFRKRKGEGEETVLDTIKAHEFGTLRFPSFVSQEARDLINSLLHPDAEHRLGSAGADHVLAHPFFSDVDWALLDNRQIHTPDWVDDMLMNHQRSHSEAIGVIDVNSQFQVNVAVMGAKDLPALRSDSVASDPYANVVVGERSERTKTVNNTVSPVWTEFFSFPLETKGSEIKDSIAVEVVHQQEHGDVEIGCVEVPLSEVLQNRKLDKSFPVVGRDGLAHGTLHLMVDWITLVERKTIEPATNSIMSFDAFFQTTDEQMLSDDILAGV